MIRYIIVAQANGSPAQSRSPSILDMIVPMVLMFVIMYLILIKPQQKKQRAAEELVQKLKAGDRVITNGGIHGTIAGVKDHTIFLKITDNVKIEINRSSVSEIVPQPEKTEK